MSVDLKARLQKVKLVIFDVDGVLTNGKINVDDNGREFKMFDVQDGFGIVLFRKAGYKTAIISARASNAVKARAADLQIDKVYLDAFPKIDAYRDLVKELKLDDSEVCFMGDDLPDLNLLKQVGFSVAVANASEDVKRHAHYITKKRGGEGAVREVLELILKAHGKWDEILERLS